MYMCIYIYIYIHVWGKNGFSRMPSKHIQIANNTYTYNKHVLI